MMDKPQDLIVIFVIAALGVTVLGFGYAQTLSARAVDTTGVYANFSVYAQNTSYFRGSSADMSEALSANDAPADQDSFLFAMGSGVLKLGKTWSATEHAMNDYGGELRIPSELIAIVSGGLLICFGLVLWIWWKGAR